MLSSLTLSDWENIAQCSKQRQQLIHEQSPYPVLASGDRSRFDFAYWWQREHDAQTAIWGKWRSLYHEQQRQELIASLCRIDPNGDYRDGDSSEPLTVLQARQILADLLNR